MTLDNRITTLSLLGKRLQEIDKDEFDSIVLKTKSENPWFTTENIEMAWSGIIKFLNHEALSKWARSYAEIERTKSRSIALVMAGNIPLVGFHDLLCVLVAGHSAVIKASSKDNVLIRYIVNLLNKIDPELFEKITFTERLKIFDAVIATGSDNSSRYFEYYFGKYPNIIRRNRTSCAILTGNETEADFQKLGIDIFSYFGLGCRNVSKVYVPVDYDFSPLFRSIEIFKEIINHHKYCNNYDYQKSLMLINKVPFLDNGFLMITEDARTVSPISVLFYETYKSNEDLNGKIDFVKDKLQCIVGGIAPATIPFGQAQYPELGDYADQIDTLKFLCDLH
jgi:hypothetical protein